MSLLVYRSKKTHLYHWRVRARNGRILADSGEGYRRAADCKRGIVLATREMVRSAVGPKA